MFLKQWSFKPLTILRRLHLEDCPKLTGSLPLDYFPKLETIVMWCVNLETITVSLEPKCPKFLSLVYLDLSEC